MSVRLLSWVGLTRPCEASYADDSGEDKEEEEIELEQGEAVVVRVPARWAQNGLLTSPS